MDDDCPVLRINNSTSTGVRNHAENIGQSSIK